MDDSAKPTTRKGWFRRYFEPNPDRTLNVAALIVTVVISLAGVAIALRQAADREQAFVMICILALFSSIFFGLLVLYLVQLVIAHQKRLRRVTRNWTKLKKQENAHVAVRFRETSRQIHAFEVASSRFLSDVIQQLIRAVESRERYRGIAGRETQDHWSTARDIYRKALDNFCLTAIKVIEAKHARNNDSDSICSASIVLLADPEKRVGAVPGKKGSVFPVILPYCRSVVNDRKDRVKDDDRIKELQIPWTEHRMYTYVMKTGEPCIVPDVSRYIEDAEQKTFHHPDRRTAEFFKSCLIVPIYGQESKGDADEPPRAHEAPTEGPAVVGFFCVDSPVANFFGKEYDLNIAKEMANFAATLICGFNLCEELHNKAMSLENAHPEPKKLLEHHPEGAVLTSAHP